MKNIPLISKEKNYVRRKGIIALLTCFLMLLLIPVSGTAQTICPITNNSYDDGYIQINDNGYVVWEGYDGTDYEIFLYNGINTTQLTNNSYDDGYLQINDNGYVVWEGYDGMDWEIFLYNGITTTQLTNNSYDDWGPQINDNGYVVWYGYDGMDWEIFLYNGITTTQITINSYNDYGPQINDNGYVVWFGWDGMDNEIFLYNGINTTQLTNNSYDDWGPQINDNGYVVWYGYDGMDNEIFLYNGITTTQLTNNSYADSNPQINDNGYVVWRGWNVARYSIFLYNGMVTTNISSGSTNDSYPHINNNGYVVWDGETTMVPEGPTDIFLYNGTSTTNLSNNNGWNSNPRINDNNLVVWEKLGVAGAEIFFYNGITTAQLTNNSYDDTYPQINDNGYVVWEGYDGSDDEIFLYTPPTWAKTYGGTDYDSAYSIQQTSDGGHIVAGDTLSFGAGSYDAWVLKLNSGGTIVWQLTYGGINSDGALSVQQTSDSGYIAAGVTQSIGAGAGDFWVLKLNSGGTIAWQLTYGGTGFDTARSIQQTSDGGYIVAGETDSFGAGNKDVWVLKLNSGGTVAWQKTYGGTTDDYAYSIQQTSDDGYIVVGNTSSFGSGNGDAWLLKLNSDGTVAWQKTYGGINSDDAVSVQQTSDDGYIVVGRTYSFGAGGSDAWLLKLNSDGTVAWQKTYGGTGYDAAHSVQQTSDGGYIVVGGTYSFGYSIGEAWLLKLNSDGTVAWQKTYGDINNDYALSVQQTSDDGYIVVGYTDSFGAGDRNVWVLKLDSNGDIVGCPITGTSSAIVVNTSVTGNNTGVTGVNTSVSAVTSTATVANTSVTPDIVCTTIDADCDGYTEDVDCDDTDPNIYPGATEVCNGVDDDCDSSIDDVLITYCRDADGDGYGEPGDSILAGCTPPLGYVANCTDNCPLVNNTQTDTDVDGLGDVCDPCINDPDNDYDADGICGNLDSCPDDPENDVDNDGICAGIGFNPPKIGDRDNCPRIANANQTDSDGNGIGDVCEQNTGEPPTCTSNCSTITDTDGDGVPDSAEQTCANLGNRNCAAIPYTDCDYDGVTDNIDNCVCFQNTNQLDTDKDGTGDVCDPDDDNDGIPDASDNCPLVANIDQTKDNDADGIGDACDDDIDGDGKSNADEVRDGTDPTKPDSDSDGYCDGPGVLKSGRYYCGATDCGTSACQIDDRPNGDSPYIVFDLYVEGNLIAKEKWFPKPYGNYPPSSNNQADWVQTDHVTLVASLYDPVATTFSPLSNVTFTITGTGAEVSNYAGVAINENEASPLNDYSFDSSNRFSTTVASPSGCPIPGCAVLYSFDYGGYVTIQATSGSYTGTITLPIDSDRDHLPDAWEGLYTNAGFNKYNKNSFSTDRTDDNHGDTDIDRSWNNTYYGDGLSNLKEYRGIIYDNKQTGTIEISHERLDPTKKNLFVRGDGFKNSLECLPGGSNPAYCSDSDVLPFTVVVPGGSAFVNSNIAVHDVTGMPSFRPNQSDPYVEPPNIDIVVVKNVYDTSTTPNGTCYGYIARLGTRLWTWCEKGYSYYGNNPTTYAFDTISGQRGTFTYHLNLMHYFYNRPYLDIISDTSDPAISNEKPNTYYNVTGYNGLLDPKSLVEDVKIENGTLDSGGNNENTNPKDNYFRGDHLKTNWKPPCTQQPCRNYRAGYQFSTFDADGDGQVELPIVSDSKTIGREYTPSEVQRHTVIHEMGHAVGIQNPEHTSDSRCVMYTDSVNWNRAGFFSIAAQQQILIHNKTE